MIKIRDGEVCPDGMYPMDFTYEPEECYDFAELKVEAEGKSDFLNLPIAWAFNCLYDEGVDVVTERECFDLVFLMPRKYGQTWGLRTFKYDRTEVLGWLDTWLREQVNEWYGWSE
jgi:hypothetical protein